MSCSRFLAERFSAFTIEYYIGCGFVIKASYNLQSWNSPLDLHHVKPRTVEDVLHEFGNDYAAFLSGIYPFENARQCEVIAKYASELRMRDAE